MLAVTGGDIQLLRYDKMIKIWTPSPLVCTYSILVDPPFPQTFKTLPQPSHITTTTPHKYKKNCHF